MHMRRNTAIRIGVGIDVGDPLTSLNTLAHSHFGDDVAEHGDDNR